MTSVLHLFYFSRLPIAKSLDDRLCRSISLVTLRRSIR
jgi:hypothetical protein